jgi:predicted nucleic acid-binding protein
VIVDTSAWIDYLIDAASTATERLDDGIRHGTRIVVPEVVLMELLAGRTDEVSARRRRRLLARFEIVPLAPMIDAERAAALHRQCRRGGETVRSLIDCLVAAVALRLDLPVLHRDQDFEVLARHTELRTEPVFGP